MILDFHVENFGSFKDEGGFSFVLPRMASQTPPKGKSWKDVTSRVVAVFGPNASGKTTLLHALGALAKAVEEPNTNLYNPYILNSGDNTDSTKYIINFTKDNDRYVYKVEASKWGIIEETLHAYKTSHKRLLFSRTLDSNGKMLFKAGNSLRGATNEVRKLVQKKQLFLSIAYKYGHSDLKNVAQGILLGGNIDINMHNENTRDFNLHWMTQQIHSGPKEWKKIAQTIAEAADFGIERVEIDEREIDPDFLKFIHAMQSVMNQDEAEEKEPFEIPEEIIDQFKRSLTFYHRGTDGREFKLSMDAQSEGTKQWFSLAGRAIEALRKGAILVVDELDSSLHPLLVHELIKLFKNDDSNKKGAQLIFNSHDTSLLGNMPIPLLEPYEVWFVDKDPSDGVSISYSMDEFDNRKSNNGQKRYLAGKFGAVPELDVFSMQKYLEEL